MPRMRIGDMLVKAGLIDEMQLQAALAQQRNWGGRLGDILVDQGMLDEMMLWLGLSKQLDVPLVSLPDLVIAPDVLPLVAPDTCEKLDIFPIVREERSLTIATSDPNNIGALDEIAFRTGLKVKTVLAPQREITWAIRAYYHGDRAPCPPPRTRRNLSSQPQPTVAQSQPPTPQMQQMQMQPSIPPGGQAQFQQPYYGAQAQSQFQQPPTTGSKAATPMAEVAMAPPAGYQVSLDEQLRQANEMLATLVDLCVQRGLFTREELWQRMNQRR